MLDGVDEESVHSMEIKQDLLLQSSNSVGTTTDLFLSNSSTAPSCSASKMSDFHAKQLDDSLDDEEEDKPDLLQMIVDDEIKQFL